MAPASKDDTRMRVAQDTMRFQEKGMILWWGVGMNEP